MAQSADEDPTADIEVGRRVREAREVRGMAQAELGRQLKFKHPSSLYRYEAGLRGFTKKDLAEIGRILKVSVEWLLIGTIRPYRTPDEPLPVEEPEALSVRGTRPVQGLDLKPMRPAIPKLMRQLYTSGTCGDISDDDEAYIVDWLSKPGNEGLSLIDLEIALKSYRVARSGGRAEEFASQQEAIERKKRQEETKRQTSDVPPPMKHRKPSNDAPAIRHKPKRRKSDR